MSTALEIATFCRNLPKLELHAHLNGSLSSSTLLALKRHYADNGLDDNTNIYTFQSGAGDISNLAECFTLFKTVQSLTSTTEALSIAVSLTLQEFQDDGCCYIELRSTPKDTPHMTKKQYVETIIDTIKKSSEKLTIISKFIVSIDRKSTNSTAEEIAYLAIHYFKIHPDIVVGIELSGDPTVGNFTDFIPAIAKARAAGLKVTLHCGEVCNPSEVKEMLEFKPDRIGHGVCIHPRTGGDINIWKQLSNMKIPVEVCLTSNVCTKSSPDYDSHHFKELYEANIPVIICTDDKGIFSTSLSQEYRLCAETFKMSQSQLAHLALNSCKFIFAENLRNKLYHIVLDFIKKCNL